MDQAYNISGKDSRIPTDSEEQLCSMALGLVNAPSKNVRQIPPVAIAQWNLFPSRFGYRAEALTIWDVISADRRYPVRRDFSGVSGGYLSAARNSLGSV